MSATTQNNFVRIVGEQYSRVAEFVHLAAPIFESEGFLTVASLEALGGKVEIVCGPPEYAPEFFLTDYRTQKRWSLADLMTIESVSKWLLSYSELPANREKQGLEADVEWIFLIITNGLDGVREFDWIGRE